MIKQALIVKSNRKCNSLQVFASQGRIDRISSAPLRYQVHTFINNRSGVSEISKTFESSKILRKLHGKSHGSATSVIFQLSFY